MRKKRCRMKAKNENSVCVKKLNRNERKNNTNE